MTSGPIPSPGMTASFREVGSAVVTGRTLVVVGALAAVVPQVERGLDGLLAARVLRLVGRRAPLRVHVVHRKTLLVVLAGNREGCSGPGRRMGAGPPDHGRAGRPSTRRTCGSRRRRGPAAGLLLLPARPATPNTAARWPCCQASPR